MDATCCPRSCLCFVCFCFVCVRSSCLVCSRSKMRHGPSGSARSLAWWTQTAACTSSYARAEGLETNEQRERKTDGRTEVERERLRSRGHKRRFLEREQLQSVGIEEKGRIGTRQRQERQDAGRRRRGRRAHRSSSRRRQSRGRQRRRAKKNRAGIYKMGQEINVSPGEPRRIACGTAKPLPASNKHKQKRERGREREAGMDQGRERGDHKQGIFTRRPEHEGAAEEADGGTDAVAYTRFFFWWCVRYVLCLVLLE